MRVVGSRYICPDAQSIQEAANSRGPIADSRIGHVAMWWRGKPLVDRPSCVLERAPAPEIALAETPSAR